MTEHKPSDPLDLCKTYYLVLVDDEFVRFPYTPENREEWGKTFQGNLAEMKCPFCAIEKATWSELKWHLEIRCKAYEQTIPMPECGRCGKCLDCLRLERSQ